MTEALGGWLLGLGLGMRHALEPDHLAAVSTLVTTTTNRRAGAWLGACWGFGHSAALFFVGTALALLHRQLPSALSVWFEVLVAFMLIGLGGRAIWQARQSRVEKEEGFHPPSEAAHGHVALPARGNHLLLFGRPFGVGVVHGLAGSGALTALVMVRLPTVTAQLIYMGLFGMGSVVGMAILSGMAGWPLAHLGRHEGAARLLATVTGAASVLLGVFWLWRSL